MPELSILLPTYNRAEMLMECLDSIKATTVDCEILVSDNASTDLTQKYMSTYPDPRVKYYRQSCNIGSHDSSRFLWLKARGEFVTMIFDDDRSITGGFESRLKILKEHPQLDFVYSLFNQIDSHGKNLGTVKWPGLLNHSYIGGRDEFSDLIVASYIWISTVIIRRTYYKLCNKNYRIKGPRRNPTYPRDMISTDWDYMLLLSLNGNSAFLHQPTVENRVHNDTDTANAKNDGLFSKCRILLWRQWLLRESGLPVITESIFQRMADSFLLDLHHEFCGNELMIQKHMTELARLKEEYIAKMKQSFIEQTANIQNDNKMQLFQALDRLAIR